MIQLGDCILVIVLASALAGLGGYHVGRRRALSLAMRKLEFLVTNSTLTVVQKIHLLSQIKEVFKWDSEVDTSA